MKVDGLWQAFFRRDIYGFERFNVQLSCPEIVRLGCTWFPGVGSGKRLPAQVRFLPGDSSLPLDDWLSMGPGNYKQRWHGKAPMWGV
jgi:hypothetical protein